MSRGEVRPGHVGFLRRHRVAASVIAGTVIGGTGLGVGVHTLVDITQPVAQVSVASAAPLQRDAQGGWDEQVTATVTYDGKSAGDVVLSVNRDVGWKDAAAYQGDTIPRADGYSTGQITSGAHVISVNGADQVGDSAVLRNMHLGDSRVVVITYQVPQSDKERQAAKVHYWNPSDGYVDQSGVVTATIHGASGSAGFDSGSFSEVSG